VNALLNSVPPYKYDVAKAKAELTQSAYPHGVSVVDDLLKAGLAATSPAERFASYAKITQAIQADVPYVGLYQEGVSVALSSKFTVPGYASSPSLNEQDDYALSIKSAG
jgi:ABC-type oligopeptide transport system substrate-binding subunit